MVNSKVHIFITLLAIALGVQASNLQALDGQASNAQAVGEKSSSEQDSSWQDLGGKSSGCKASNGQALGEKSSSEQALGVQKYNFSAENSIELKLNQGVQNRLQVKNGFLLEVVGDENKYMLTWGADGQNVFITPKVGKGDNVSLSLITVGGKAQDLNFTVIDKGAGSIVINMQDKVETTLKQPAPAEVIPAKSAAIAPAAPAEIAPAENSAPAEVSAVKNAPAEVVALFKAMLNDSQHDNYYVVKKEFKLNSSLPKVTMMQKAFYAGEHLVGAIVKVANLNAAPQIIKASDFNDLYEGTIAVNLREQQLDAYASTEVLIVTKR